MLPKQAEILIYDANGREFLLKYLSAWSVETLHVRGEYINIPVLLDSLLRRGRSRADSYINAYIARVNPKLIITFVDNNSRFYRLSREFPESKTIFLQNGGRGYYADIFEWLENYSSTDGELHVDVMGTFGSAVAAKYSRSIGGLSAPLGSLKSNQIQKWPKIEKEVIAFISQYRTNNGFTMGGRFFSFKEHFEPVDRMVLGFLVQYAKKRSKKLKIVQRFSNNSANMKSEQVYFSRLTNGFCEFYESCDNTSSYHAIDKSEVTVGIDSTLAYESAARGNKTALFPIRTHWFQLKSWTFGWPGNFPPEGPFWTNNPDLKKFEQILDTLFSIDESQWWKMLGTVGYDKIMKYDPGNSILQSLIKETLSPRGKGQKQKPI